MSSRSPRTFPPFWPTSTCGDVSHRQRKAETRAGIPVSIATSAGVAAALWTMLMARMLAEGTGDSSAWMRDSSEAKESTCVKETGPSSLIAKLTSMAGSSVYCLRMAVIFGRNWGIRGGILLANASR